MGPVFCRLTGLTLSEMVIDCEKRNYPALLEGDIFTGVREGDPRPEVELDNRRMSERAAEKFDNQE